MIIVIPTALRCFQKLVCPKTKFYLKFSIDFYLFFRYYKIATMGKAARNHGGTGGHGVSPMFGEKPNFNRHVMGDRLLLGLVPTNQQSMLSHQKVSSKLSMTGVVETLPDSCKVKRFNETGLQQAPPLRSPSQESASVKQSVASVKQHVPSVKQLGDSVKQPGASVKPHVAPVKQPVALDKKPIALVKQSVAPVKQHVASVEQPVDLVENPVASVKQHVASGKQYVSSVKKPVASVKHNVASVKQSVASVNQPDVSDKQPLAPGDQQVSSFKQQVNLEPDTLLEQQTLISDKPLNNSIQETLIKTHHPVSIIDTVNLVKPPVTYQDILQEQQALGSGQKSMIKAQLPVTKIQQSVASTQHSLTSVKQPVTSCFSQDILQEQQTLSSDHSLINTSQKSVIKVQLPVTTFQHSDKSTQHSVTSDDQAMTSVQLSGSSIQGIDTMQEQHTIGSEQSLINSDQTSVIKAQLPVTVFQHYVTSNQQSVTSVMQPMTSTKQSLTSVKQPVTSTEQTLTSVKQPVMSVKLQQTSAPSLDKLQEQHTLTSAQLKIGSGQQFPNVADMTQEHRVNKLQGYHEVPNPMVYLPAILGWVKVSPTFFSYPSIPVPFPSGLVQIQLSPGMFISNSRIQAHQVLRAQD